MSRGKKTQKWPNSKSGQAVEATRRSPIRLLRESYGVREVEKRRIRKNGGKFRM